MSQVTAKGMIEVGAAQMDYIEVVQRKLDTMYGWHTPALTNQFSPRLPGQLEVFCGASWHGKSMMARHSAFIAAMNIVNSQDAGRDDPRCVVLVNYELSSGEEFKHIVSKTNPPDVVAAWDKSSRERLTDDDYDLLSAGISRTAGLPFYTIAATDATGAAAAQVDMSLESVAEQLQLLRSRGRVIEAIYFDYLQLIPPPAGSGNDKVVRVEKTLAMLKQIGRECGAPVQLTTQAHRTRTFARVDKMPTSEDSKWSLAPYAMADKYVVMCIPSKFRPADWSNDFPGKNDDGTVDTYPIDYVLSDNGNLWHVTGRVPIAPNVQIVRILKEKNRAIHGGATFPILWNFDTGECADYLGFDQGLMHVAPYRDMSKATPFIRHQPGNTVLDIARKTDKTIAF